MNEIQSYYVGQHITTLYSGTLSMGSVEDLIEWLKLGVKLDEAICTGLNNDIHLSTDKFPDA